MTAIPAQIKIRIGSRWLRVSIASVATMAWMLTQPSIASGATAQSGNTASLLRPASAETRPAGKCSIARRQTIKLASWKLNAIPYAAMAESGAFEHFVAMLHKIDADVFALQKVSATADEVVRAASVLRGNGSCFKALVSEPAIGVRYALLYDAAQVELLYPAVAQGRCNLAEPVDVIGAAPVIRPTGARTEEQQTAQFGYFRAIAEAPEKVGRFDFALVNVHVGEHEANLDELTQLVEQLPDSYPWLSEERDIIVAGHLGVGATPGRLRGNYFPGMKPLINPLLMISLGLSDMSFDEAVGRMSSRAPGSERPPPALHYDQLLVRRWDRPGRCASALYCGGLEEFITARVYRHDKVLARPVEDFETLVSDHDPVAARFCKFADTDPVVDVSN